MKIGSPLPTPAGNTQEISKFLPQPPQLLARLIKENRDDYLMEKSSFR
jgi:hypothetical protein